MIYRMKYTVMIPLPTTMIAGLLLSALLLLHYDDAKAANNTNYNSSMVKFYFHLKNKHVFNNVKIGVTGEKGQPNAWRLILFLSNNIQRDAIPGFFHAGEKVTACITNYSKDSYKNCGESVVGATGEAHFNLIAAPS
jgi:hypothetical protein